MGKDVFIERLRPWAKIGFNLIIVSKVNNQREIYACVSGLHHSPRLFIRRLNANEDEATHVAAYQKLLVEFNIKVIKKRKAKHELV